jgi:hypothetical protein
MKKIHYPISLLAVIIGFTSLSCEKEEGIGGTSSITGKIVVRQYNLNFTTLTEQYYAPDENVFIVYGGDAVYGDKTSTNYDGTYRFEYLREGKYTIYAYSKDSANYPTQHEIPVMREVEISGKNKEVVVDNIVILK